MASNSHKLTKFLTVYSSYQSIPQETKTPTIKNFPCSKNEFKNRNSNYFQQCKLYKAPSNIGDMDDPAISPNCSKITSLDTLDELLQSTRKLIGSHSPKIRMLSSNMIYKQSPYKENFGKKVNRHHNTLSVKLCNSRRLSSNDTLNHTLEHTISAALKMISSKDPIQLNLSHSNLTRVKSSIFSLTVHHNNDTTKFSRPTSYHM